MIKRKIDSYLAEYYTRERNALLVTGSRQIGKTYSIRQLGKSFTSFVEINFVASPEAITIFREARNTKDILLRLSALTSVPLVPGATLIFFDEVQLCPEIVTAIKALVEEGSYRYILSGSLLGVALQDLRSEPVGYMGIKEMYPLDLEEFFEAVGVQPQVIDSLYECWRERKPVDPIVHAKMIELFRLYLIIGGMPAVVAKYLETNNLQDVLSTQQSILQLYRRDIAQYAPKEKLEIEEIFDLIPSELNAKNKRFILKRLNEGARFSRYENRFVWLARAGVALPVYNVEEPKVPLRLARSRNLFKLFQSDVGLLAAQYAEGIQLRILREDRDINFGSVYENAIAQELFAHGFAPCYYNSKKQGELDFLVEQAGQVLPIEVKSGKDYTSHRALSRILEIEDYDINEALVLSGGNLSQEGKILYAPVYMIMFVRRRELDSLVYRVDLSSIQ